jgi:NTE family protein
LGLVPRGRVSTESFGRLIDNVVPSGQWAPHSATWIMVVDAATGRRVPLGLAGHPSVPLREAVRASYAVPGWCEPITIDRQTYLDGGIASPTSADLLIDTDVEEAIVLAPMASRAWDLPRELKEPRIAKRLREHMTRIVNREVHALEQAGIRVLRLEPSAEDLVAFGPNMMSVRRRRHVFDTAVVTAKDAVADAMLVFRDDRGPESGRVDRAMAVAHAS